MTQLTCDGCGRSADAAHIQQRIRRLELATSFRPIHIGVLLIHPAPPAPLQDFFYAAEQSHGSRSPAGREFFDRLIQAVGIPVSAGMDEASALSDFQRRGLFLASAAECPLEPGAQTMESFAPTLIQRIQFSYKPKHIALLSDAMRPLVPHLDRAGLAGRLVLWRGGPLPGPEVGLFSQVAAECLLPLVASTHP